MRRADPSSAGIRRRAGVTRSFQISEYSIEPSKSVAVRNLLAKDEFRATLLDEPKPRGPEVAFVGDAGALLVSAGLRDRLTRTRTCPDAGVVGNAGETQGVAPAADPSEEMALSGSANVICGEIDDGACVNSSGRDGAGTLKLGEPGDRVRFDLIVKRPIVHSLKPFLAFKISAHRTRAAYTARIGVGWSCVAAMQAA